MREKDYKRLDGIAAGEQLTRPVYIDKMEDNTTATGKNYVSFTVSDSSCKVKANFFETSKHETPTVEWLNQYGIVPGTLIQITLEKNTKGFLNVVSIARNKDQDVTLKDFAQKADGDANERYDTIVSILQEISGKKKALNGDQATISDLALELYREYEEQLKWSAAAEIMHSEKAGGLMEHTEAMVRNAVKVCEVYSDLDEELLVVSAALHDIGKIEELSTDPLGRATYSVPGIALGHIVLGYTYVDRFVQKHSGIYPEERVLLLKSMILSHQGQKEYGSPVEPIIKEAYMLYFLDEMDAKYWEIKKGLQSLKPGEVSPGSVLGIKHRIYHPLEE